MIQSNHYGFYNNHSNDVFQSVQGAYMLSSTSFMKKGESKGAGSYIYENNYRICIALYIARSLIKSTWVNSNDVYYTPIGEPK